MPSKKPRLASIASASLSPRNAGGFRARTLVRSPLEVALGAFRTDCDEAIQELRFALTALAKRAECDPLKPQDVSRRFGINKNLTWKFARILLANEAFEAIPMLPGPEGVEIYLRAFESKNIGRADTDPVRAAIRKFDQIVARHFGERAQLEVVLDGLRSDGNLESSRRMAFKGMAGVFGVQARLRLTAQILKPSAQHQNKADLALVVGLAGLQRLRPIGALPVFRSGAIIPTEPLHPQPLFKSDGTRPEEFLLREFSSFPNATVTAADIGGRHIVELSEGPLGRIGESDLVFGSHVRDVMNLRRLPTDTSTEVITAVSIPAESLVSDLFVHKSIDGLDTLQTSIHSTLSQPVTTIAEQRANTMLPIDCAPLLIEDLAQGYGLSTLSNYETMMASAFAALGAKLADYRLIRVAMVHPPAPSALLVRWDLPE